MCRAGSEVRHSGAHYLDRYAVRRFIGNHTEARRRSDEPSLVHSLRAIRNGFRPSRCSGPAAFNVGIPQRLCSFGRVWGSQVWWMHWPEAETGGDDILQYIVSPPPARLLHSPTHADASVIASTSLSRHGAKSRLRLWHGGLAVSCVGDYHSPGPKSAHAPRRRGGVAMAVLCARPPQLEGTRTEFHRMRAEKTRTQPFWLKQLL